jgi:hypothetical protein
LKITALSSVRFGFAYYAVGGNTRRLRWFANQDLPEVKSTMPDSTMTRFLLALFLCLSVGNGVNWKVWKPGPSGWELVAEGPTDEAARAAADKECKGQIGP